MFSTVFHPLICNLAQSPYSSCNSGHSSLSNHHIPRLLNHYVHNSSQARSGSLAIVPQFALAFVIITPFALDSR